ncbi:hypothetical protein ATN84_16910 [Paramesorhizobium deserti]|uniref:Uncharacterized protein n=1 Tax=Paramesorhizobium deserti TaxID=1494590 RepID=A0A135HR39_9HYPH|nr:hypothetical protein [Paramesorhizobium deserti]KXF75668.1 hypothetical protein ATN84_16910 [Paramesorhizobium deserti]
MSVRSTGSPHRDFPFTTDVLARWNWVFALSCVASALLLCASFIQDIVLYSGTEADLSNKIWLLDVDSEESAFTWLSVIVAFCAAGLLFRAGSEASMRNSRFIWHWYFLAALFMLLSFDEFAGIHEKISAVLSLRMENTGLLYFAWAAPAGVISVFGLAVFVPFIRSFSPRLAVLLVISAVVFLSGAVGFEMIGGSVAELEGVGSFRYRILTNFEEGLEMAGMLIFIFVVLSHLEGNETSPRVLAAR